MNYIIRLTFILFFLFLSFNSEEQTIDSNGKTLINSISFSKWIKGNTSYGLLKNELRNQQLKKEIRLSQAFRYSLTLKSIILIFLDFLVLYLIFKLIGKISILYSTHRTMKASGITKEELKKIDLPTGEIFAAIAMAIYEATEMHDEENTIITIKNTARNYSPWNSKIYTLRKNPYKL